MADGWAQALDAFADHLRRHAALAARAVEPGDVPGHTWPDDLGPLPASLLPRATALLAEADQLAGRHRERLAHVATTAKLLDRTPQPRSAARSRLDVRG